MDAGFLILPESNPWRPIYIRREPQISFPLSILPFGATDVPRPLFLQHVMLRTTISEALISKTIAQFLFSTRDGVID
ncbi:MAG: hypothetical protein IID61_00880 [SAR324 cluster bacterium]|nr:hypothetical protein [SAR324 cluster bacterium]